MENNLRAATLSAQDVQLHSLRDKRPVMLGVLAMPAQGGCETPAMSDKCDVSCTKDLEGREKTCALQRSIISAKQAAGDAGGAGDACDVGE